MNEENKPLAKTVYLVDYNLMSFLIDHFNDAHSYYEELIESSDIIPYDVVTISKIRLHDENSLISYPEQNGNIMALQNYIIRTWRKIIESSMESFKTGSKNDIIHF